MTRPYRHVPGSARHRGYSPLAGGMIWTARTLCGEWWACPPDDDSVTHWAVLPLTAVDAPDPGGGEATAPEDVDSVTCPRCRGVLLGQMWDAGLPVRQ